MKAYGAAPASDDCFARLDEAFARLEEEPERSASRAAAQRSEAAADLTDFEEAFTSIDQQLGGALSERITAGPRGNMALVPPAPSTIAEPPRAAVAASPGGEELWRRHSGAGAPLERLVDTMHDLLWLQRAIHSRGPRVADRVKFEDVAEIVSDARQLCVDFDLQTARVRSDFALAALEKDGIDLLAAEVGELIRHIRHDLKSCSIWPISKGRAWAFGLSLGERAHRAFPSAGVDVAEGGRCAGFGFHSASVFHFLRAAAYGMRALAAAARGQRAAVATPEWAATIAMVEARHAAARRWPASEAKTTATSFYEAVLNDARTLHDAQCRIATGGIVDEHHALAIVHATRAFLTRLADHVVERQERPLTKKDFAGVAEGLTWAASRSILR